MIKKGKISFEFKILRVRSFLVSFHFFTIRFPPITKRTGTFKINLVNITYIQIYIEIFNNFDFKNVTFIIRESNLRKCIDSALISRSYMVN